MVRAVFPKVRFGPSVATLVFLALGSAAAADSATEDYAVGRAEYVSACAACHGEAADGNGSIASMFQKRVPDLTGLARRNDGKFPFLEVVHIIDGRSVMRAHGNPMPVFGGRFRTEAQDRGAMYGAEAITRARVLELAIYLQSIQK